MKNLAKKPPWRLWIGLAENNPVLAKTSQQERFDLYRETGGKPLLLRWTAGQIGRGSCLTLSDAITYLRSCPQENDPLEFIFGDLVEDFSEAESRVLCALTYFTLSTKLEHMTDVAACTKVDADHALRSLINRSLVVPSEELKTFALVPLVADFLRKKKPEVVAETGNRLAKHAFAILVENGYGQHERFPLLDAAWPTVAAALPRFLVGPNEQLQTVCEALTLFLEYTGHWDEWLALLSEGESRALSNKDFLSAGWRAYQAGRAYYLRWQAAEVLACADRSETHWIEAQAGAREMAVASTLRGHGYKVIQDYQRAIPAYREAVELLRSLSDESEDIANGLNCLAMAEHLSGDLVTAERDYRESLRIARVVNYREGVATSTGNLAGLALSNEDWRSAEALAREALLLAENVGRQELIASNCHRLARALARQGKNGEALPYAQRAVKILNRLGSPELTFALQILVECEPSGGLVI